MADPMTTTDTAAAFLAGALAMREAAGKVVEASQSQKCDCIEFDGNYWLSRCNCQNSGDLADAQAWCSSANFATAIRAIDPAALTERQVAPVVDDAMTTRAGHAYHYATDGGGCDMLAMRAALEAALEGEK